jgi:multidrug resistance efflux pump
MEGDKRGGSNAFLPWLLCILMAIAWASVGIRYYRANPNASNAAAPNGPSTPPGEAPKDSAGNPIKKEAPKQIARNPDEPVLDMKGYIIPAHTISVSPIEVSGRIVRLEIEEGKSFKKDDVLAVIDDSSFRADRDEAKANWDSLIEKMREMKNGNRPEEIEQARAELLEAEANLKAAQLEWERYQGKKVDAIARKDFDTVESSYRGGLARVAKLRQSLRLMELGPREERVKGAIADVDAAKARLDRAEWRLKNCTIFSPVDGVILAKRAEIGSLINPVVGGVATSLCDIADLSDIEVDMEIQERDVSKVFDGQYCKIKADAFPERSYDGYVDRSMPIANRARGIVPIRIKVVVPPTEKQGKYLKPDMGVAVTFFNKRYDKWPNKWNVPVDPIPGSLAPAPAAEPKNTPPAVEPKNPTPSESKKAG